MIEIVEAGKLTKVLLKGVQTTIELEVMSAHARSYQVYRDGELLGRIENREGEWRAVIDEDLPHTQSGSKEEAIRMLLDYHTPIEP